MTRGLMCFVAALFAAAILLGASAEAERGKRLFKQRCSGCHAADRDLEGPRLRNVFGRHAGAVPKFPYSDAIKKAEITWNAETLDKWLADPDAFVPGDNMGFHVPGEQDRKDLIRYLEQLSGKSARE